MSSQTEAPFNLERPIKTSIPIPWILAFCGFLITLGIAWANIQNELSSNRVRTDIIERRVDSDHEVLIEIRADVKRLLREKQP